VKLEIRQRDRRALMLLALAIVIYIVGDWVLLPAYDRISDAQEVAADKETQLRRYRRAELRKGQYEGLLKVADQRVIAGESVVINAANLSLASAELQSLVESAANNTNIMLSQRAMGIPRRLNDFYAELTMTLGFEATPNQLVMLLNELRAMPRFVSVRSLQVAPVSPVFEAPKGVDLLKTVRVAMIVSVPAPADLVKTAGATK